MAAASTSAPEETKPKKPVTKFRTADPDPKVSRKRRAGGPVVELEASLIRGLEPLDPEPAAAPEAPTADAPAESAPERPAETETWRRTAMAELTALATDSDDLTPRRRR